MKPPSHFAIEEDLRSAAFRMGVKEGKWGVSAGADALDGISYPRVYLWVAAGARAGAPSAVHFSFDITGYRGVPPTGYPWDAEGWKRRDFAHYPKGAPNSRVEKVFRTDGWAEANNALYHPYDRVASLNHPNWAMEHRGLVWTSAHTIVDLLADLHVLLNSKDYLGV